jgi:hypothetical protein
MIDSFKSYWIFHTFVMFPLCFVVVYASEGVLIGGAESFVVVPLLSMLTSLWSVFCDKVFGLDG